MKLNTKKINLELKRLGWSKVEFAAKMGISRQSVHYYTKCGGGTSFRIVERIAKALGVEPKDLIQ